MKTASLALFIFLEILIFSPAMSFPVYIPEHDVLSLNNNANEELDPSNIKLFSWNIYKGKNKGFRPSFFKFANNPGIYLFQEYYSGNNINSYIQSLENKHSVIALSYGISLWGETGVTTISSTKQSRVKTLRTNATEDFTLSTYKTSLFSWYNLKNSNDKLLVVNIHLLVSVDNRTYSNELNRIEKQINKHSGPLILAGDFNDWPKRKRILQNWLNRNKLHRVSFSPDHRTSYDGNRIDHIFYRNLKLKESWSTKTKASDHNPVAALFSI